MWRRVDWRYVGECRKHGARWGGHKVKFKVNVPQESRARDINPYIEESDRINIFRLTEIRETNRNWLGVIIDQAVMQGYSLIQGNASRQIIIILAGIILIITCIDIR